MIIKTKLAVAGTDEDGDGGSRVSLDGGVSAGRHFGGSSRPRGYPHALADSRLHHR